MRHGRMALVLVVVCAVILGALAGAEAAVSPPALPTGPAAAAVGDVVSFSASGASCAEVGHELLYRVDFGDGSPPSDWVPSGQGVVHSYTAPGPYHVSAQARCPVDSVTSVSSAAADIVVIALADEAVSAPTSVAANPKAAINDLRSYTASGAVSNAGHSLEYLFDWGDGTQSDWIASGTASHAYGVQGTYSVRAMARCQVHPDKVSAWSSPHVQDVAVEYGVHPPLRPGACCPNGSVNVAYIFSAGGAVADCGDTPEYQFDWGDGTQSEWGAGTCTHSFVVPGTYYVRARARCPIHGVVSVLSEPLVIAIGDAEVVCAPAAPACSNDARSGQPVTIHAAGAVSNLGHPVEYQFHWGDGGPDSDWAAAASVTHTFSDPGTYSVTVRARCQLHHDVVSDCSPALALTVRVLEAISQPDAPSGPEYILQRETAAFTAAGGVSDVGHTVEYQFDWGDGALSPWVPYTASHFYAAAGTCYVKVRARCCAHTYSVSIWSSGHRLVVGPAAPENITTPPCPDGPSSGLRGQNLTFTTGGATSNLGHALEYQLDWGDGSPYSPWSALLSAQHAFASGGDYQIHARARCAGDSAVISSWSAPKPVHIVWSYCRLNCTVKGQGSVCCDPQKDTYEQGEEVTLSAAAPTGWRFHHWEGDASGSDNPLRLTLTQDTNVVAVFGQGSYLLRVGSSGHGTVWVNPEKLAYNAGDWVQLMAIPDEAYSFAAWSGGLTGSLNPAVISIDSDLDINATFTPQVCRLQVVIQPPGGGTLTLTPQKNTYAWGETVHLAAVASPGHEFNHWGCDASGTDPETDIVVTGNMRLKAVFALTTSVHFPVPPAQESRMNVLGGISVCGEPAAPGDEIAVLGPQGQLCGQFTVVDPEGEYGLIRVYGDDPTTPEVEGAQPGDPLTFVLWDSWHNTEVPLEAVAAGGGPVIWTADAAPQQAQLATICQEQIPLSAGWNLVSFRTNRCYYSAGQPPAVPLLIGTLPVAGPISQALGSLGGQLPVVRGFDLMGAHTFDPAMPEAVNDLTYLAPGYGYWIKVSQPCTLNLLGGRVRPQVRLPLQLGWNLVGCWANSVKYVGAEPPTVPFGGPPTPEAVKVGGAGEFLPQLAGCYGVLRGFDAAGAHTYDPTLPDFLSDLGYMGPGYGYWLKMRLGLSLGY